MNNKGEFPNRRSIRLEGYDYSQDNAYFVTVCTKDRLPTIDSDMIRGIIQKTWENLPHHYPNVILDEFVIMPNHVHGIIIIQNESVGADLRSARPLSEIVRAFKSFSTRELNKHFGIHGLSFWQRNYYEHVIRNDDDLYQTRNYIRGNPLRWDADGENPGNLEIGGAQKRGRTCTRISKSRSMS